MKYFFLAGWALVNVGLGAGYEDRTLGLVKAVRRTVAVDLNTCKAGWTTGGDSYGLWGET